MAKAKAPVKGNIVAGFLTQVRDELRNVTWPTRKEIWNKTLVVIGVSVVVGAYLGALDYLLTRLMGIIL